jgi:hypothetical protein
MRGGPRPGSGRPPGATTRLTPEATRARLDTLRAPGESWAALATRLGVVRQAVSRAVTKGATERVIVAWERLS